LIVGQGVLERLQAHRVGGTHQDRGKDFHAIGIGGQLIETHPDLAVEGSAAGVKNTDHAPVAAAEAQPVPHAGVDVPPGDRFAHHHFPLTRLEPAALHQLQVGTHSDAHRGETADVHVGPLGTVVARQIDDGHYFGGNHGLPLQLLNPRLIANTRNSLAGDLADQLREGVLPHYQKVERMPSGLERLFQASDQGQDPQ